MTGALDQRLDALLAELAPPPVPAELAGRVVATAKATAQEPHAGRARRAAARRDRRGRWRRGLVIGAGAIGLAFSGAVAATLAGLPLPARIEAVIAKLPLIEHQPPAPVERPHPRLIERVSAPVTQKQVLVHERPTADLVRLREIRQLRRLEAVRRVAAARRAAGLPTPRADRIERRIQRRLSWWRQATPAQRQRFMELRRHRLEARRRARLQSGSAAPLDEFRQSRSGVQRLGKDRTSGPARPRAGKAQADGDGEQRIVDFRERQPRPMLRRMRPAMRRRGAFHY